MAQEQSNQIRDIGDERKVQVQHAEMMQQQEIVSLDGEKMEEEMDSSSTDTKSGITLIKEEDMKKSPSSSVSSSVSSSTVTSSTTSATSTAVTTTSTTSSAYKSLPGTSTGTRQKKVFKPNELRQALMPTLEKLLRQDPESLPFRQPVDPVLLQIPDYFDVIKKPMDLSTIKTKLDTGQYQQPWQYVDDMYQMFDNAWTYNRKTSKVHRYCTKLCDLFEQEIDPIMRSLGYCCGRRKVFQPQVLYCSGKQLCTIPRDAKYMNYQNRIAYCLKCFSETPGHSISVENLGMDPTMSGKETILKKDFSEMKNDQLHYEPFIECGDCGRKLHQICVCRMGAIWPEGFTCDGCLKKRKATSLDNRRLSIQRCIQSLVHACQCRYANCRHSSCSKMKRVVIHAKICKRKGSGVPGSGGSGAPGCPICKQLIALCCYHAKHCNEAKCTVPYCVNIKQKLKQQQMQQRYQGGGGGGQQGGPQQQQGVMASPGQQQQVGVGQCGPNQGPMMGQPVQQQLQNSMAAAITASSTANNAPPSNEFPSNRPF